MQGYYFILAYKTVHERPITPDELLNDPRVNAEFRKTYIESNMGSTVPPLAVEQGGHIVIKNSFLRTYKAIRVPTGTGAGLTTPLYRSGEINGEKIVGHFHTHPNAGPGWDPWPGVTDMTNITTFPARMGQIIFVISTDNIYVTDRLVSVTSWRILAPTLGNVR